ncbi:MAG: transcription repressor NadR [Thermaerobacterales bacterium]
MKAATTPEDLVRLLQDRGAPVTGNELADLCGVTRTVIVHDIALLRAAGEPISATPQGYVFNPGEADTRRRFSAQLAVQHGPAVELIEKELNAIVDEGAFIRDVIVEHPVYGEIRGLLTLGSRHDVAEFCRRMRQTGAEPISSLTEGVHLHTIEAPDLQTIERARRVLERLGLLVDETA